MRRWLSRLAFSFLIFGGVLIFEGYRAGVGRSTTKSQPRATMMIAAGAGLIGIGLAGIRERHRRPPSE